MVSVITGTPKNEEAKRTTEPLGAPPWGCLGRNRRLYEDLPAEALYALEGEVGIRHQKQIAVKLKPA